MLPTSLNNGIPPSGRVTTSFVCVTADMACFERMARFDLEFKKGNTWQYDLL